MAFANQISFREAIGRLYDRREAVSLANPYSVAIIAHAKTFLYQHGVLCYIDNNYIRILDIHRAEKTEQIWNIKYTLNRIFQQSDDYAELSLLHYCAGVLAILVYMNELPWLIVLDITPSVDFFVTNS